MPKEVEYHIRALFSALAWTVAIAYWNREPRVNFWNDATATMLLCYIGSLAMLWWSGPENTAEELIEPLKRLLHSIAEKFHNHKKPNGG